MALRVVSFKIPEEVYEEIVEIVRARNMSLSEFIREAVRDKLNKEKTKRFREKWGLVVIGDENGRNERWVWVGL
jgi:metal-responsive CopG/Arc/MetJ family transcriptional regulator